MNLPGDVGVAGRARSSERNGGLVVKPGPSSGIWRVGPTITPISPARFWRTAVKVKQSPELQAGWSARRADHEQVHAHGQGAPPLLGQKRHDPLQEFPADLLPYPYRQ